MGQVKNEMFTIDELQMAVVRGVVNELEMMLRIVPIDKSKLNIEQIERYRDALCIVVARRSRA